MSALPFLQSVIYKAASTTGLVVAAWATVHGEPRLAPGDFVLVSMYIGRLFLPVMQLVRLFEGLSETLTDLEKAVVLLTMEPEVVDKDDALDLTLSENKPAGDIVFKNVSFHYKPAAVEEAQLLYEDSESDEDSSSDEHSNSDEHSDEGGVDKGSCEQVEATDEKAPGGVSNIPSHVAPGKTVALVGASGSGKSTVCRLLLRLYDVDAGQILIDGRDVRDRKQNSLRLAVGLVSQELVLFNDTLRYNLLFGAQDASDAQVLDALKAAAMAPFLNAHEKHLDYSVGNRVCRFCVGSSFCSCHVPWGDAKSLVSLTHPT